MTARSTWRQFGDCPKCGEQIAIKQDGFLRVHSVGEGTARRRCDGAAEEPVAGTQRTVLTVGRAW